MNKGWRWSKGFTLIELMIVIAIFCIIVALVAPAITGNSSGTRFGFGGTTQTRCHDGFKVIVGMNGHVQQLIDENGHGVRCN